MNRSEEKKSPCKLTSQKFRVEWSFPEAGKDAREKDEENVINGSEVTAGQAQESLCAIAQKGDYR